jgi:hypothetical protein
MCEAPRHAVYDKDFAVWALTVSNGSAAQLAGYVLWGAGPIEAMLKAEKTMRPHLDAS